MEIWVWLFWKPAIETEDNLSKTRVFGDHTLKNLRKLKQNLSFGKINIDKSKKT